MKDLKEKYSITLDPDVAKEIRRMAEEDDRNFSQYINMILKKWVKQSVSSNENSSPRLRDREN